MDVNLPEGHAVVLLLSPAAGFLDCGILHVSLHEMASEHDHARHPEEKNLISGDEQRGRIENRLVASFLRPAERRKGQQSRGKPGVEHIRDLLQLCAAALRALRRSFARDDYFLAAFTCPRRNAMSPPQLARDAPVVDVVHPVQVNLFVVLRNDCDLAAFYGLNYFLRQRLNLDEPLLGQTRLDYGSAAVALAEGERVVFFGDEKPAGL